MKYKPYWIVIISVILTINAASAEGDYRLPENMQQDVNRLLSLRKGLWWNRDEAQTAISEFHDLMQRVAEKVTPDVLMTAAQHEGSSLNAKLVRIAADRAAHPDRYEELFKIYIVPPENLIDTKTGQGPWLGDELWTEGEHPHLNQRYRYAIEYYALVGDYRRYMFAAALGAIADEKSIIVIRNAFEDSAALPALDRATESRQRSMMSALLRYESPLVIPAIFEFIELSNEQAARLGQQPRIGLEDVPMSEYLYRALTAMHDKPFVESWRKILAEYPKEKLDPAQRELIDRILNAEVEFHEPRYRTNP